MHTKDHLAQELRNAGLDEMADRAAEGYYHDYLSPLATPELQLLNDLQRAHHGGNVAAARLISMHMRGDFDASAEESEEWIESEDGQLALSLLMPRASKH